MRSAVPQRRARSKPAVKGGALESPRRCAVRRTWGLITIQDSQRQYPILPSPIART